MRNIEFQNIELTQKLFGYHNTHLEKISNAFNVTINARSNAISLSGIKGIEFVTFTKEDVAKHPLVSNIIDAYEKNKN